MDIKDSRRKFMKQFLALSAFSAGSLLSSKTGINTKIFNVGITDASAMDNPDFAASIPDKTLRIKYKGISCFMITASNGTKIITDPISALGKEPADIVTVSNGHYNHCDVYWVAGFPYIYKRVEPYKIEGITFRGVLTHHLEMDEGRKIRPGGDNYVICFELEGMNICHLGALGSKLTSDQVKQIGRVDILMAPVGGVSTLPVADAVEVCRMLNPKVVIPMHYKSRQFSDIPGAGVDEFLKLMDNGGNEKGGRQGFVVKEFKASELPSQMQVIVL
jgi:L-ascorbate metabolism protein UlaG (beta-lactamase superfamily)